MNADFQLDMESDDPLNEGWYSEASVGEILWDLFDNANEAGDTLSLGFAPLYAVITGAQKTTDAVTSIFTFATGLKAANGGSAAAIDTLLNGEDIDGSGDFATGETNDAGDPQILPIFRTIALNSQSTVCSRSPAGNVSTNKVGNRVFLRFDNNVARIVTIMATGAADGPGTVAAIDPDIYVLRQGTLAAVGVEVGSSETISQVQLPAGIYIVEVYDFQLAGAQPHCMTVSITGA
jgi:hypothetical protein